MPGVQFSGARPVKSDESSAACAVGLAGWDSNRVTLGKMKSPSQITLTIKILTNNCVPHQSGAVLWHDFKNVHMGIKIRIL